eukprot:1193136-Prymnesium_polylepis.1
MLACGPTKATEMLGTHAHDMRQRSTCLVPRTLSRRGCSHHLPKTLQAGTRVTWTIPKHWGARFLGTAAMLNDKYDMLAHQFVELAARW